MTCPFATVDAPTVDIVSVVVDKPKRQAALRPATRIQALYTSNPQRLGTRSYGYNAALWECETVQDALDRGIPQHHLRWALKQGWIVTH